MHGTCSVVIGTICLFCLRINTGGVHEVGSTPPLKGKSSTNGTLGIEDIAANVTYEPHPPLEFWSPMVTRREQSALAGKSNNGRRLKLKKGNKKPKKYYSQQTKISMLRSNPREESFWGKVKALKYTLQEEDGNVLHSTRLLPVQLMQDESTTSQPISHLSNEHFAFPPKDVLSPYTLKDDFIRISKMIDTNITVEVIGRTLEFNDIVLCKISEKNKVYFRADEDKYAEDEPGKKIIFIVHGLSAVGFRTIPSLYEKAELLKLLHIYMAHLDKFDIYLIPMANPDGIGDETLGDIWNKNKSPQSACSGVALDRNFDVAWNISYVNSCSPHYPGPTPFSEPESRAVADVLHQNSHKIVAYIHVHAGAFGPEVFKGDAVLYPKGFTETNSDDDNYIDIKGEIDEAIKNAGFRVMSVAMDTLYNWYGKIHGSSVDYASSIYGIPYAMEFVMQPYELDPSALENMTEEEKISKPVLQEIWRRVIDVIFTNIHKNTHPDDVQ